MNNFANAATNDNVKLTKERPCQKQTDWREGAIVGLNRTSIPLRSSSLTPLPITSTRPLMKCEITEA